MRKTAAGFLVGLGAAAVVLGADLLFTLLGGGTGVNPLQTVELKTYDWRLTRTARPETARQDIVLVEIDEFSIRNLEPYAGGWPWPRVVHSMLLDYLSRGPAKVIVYDVNFAEPDDQGSFEFGNATMSGAESDQYLADSIKAAGNVILLADATYEAGEGGSREFPDAGFALDAPGIIERRVVFPPFGGLASVSAGLGHNLFVLDPDGPLRHTVPFVRNGDRELPSLGLSAALKVAGIGPDKAQLKGTILTLGDRAMPLSSRRVRTQTGTDVFLWGLINFRGAAFLEDLKSRTYPTYSAFNLLSSEQQLLSGGKPDIDPAVFRDKLVFVGVTGVGLFDVFQTPFGTVKMPGINIHAAVADDVLSNRFMRPESARHHARVGARDGSRRRRARRSVTGVVGHGRHRHHRGRIRGGCDAGLFRRLLVEPVPAGAGRLGRLVWRRRLSVLRGGPREAEDEAALRAVRLQGRLRPARQ